MVSQELAAALISLEHQVQDLVCGEVDAVELKSVAETPHASEKVQNDVLDGKRGRRRRQLLSNVGEKDGLG